MKTKRKTAAPIPVDRPGDPSSARVGVCVSDPSSFMATNWKPGVKMKHPVADAAKFPTLGPNLEKRRIMLLIIASVYLNLSALAVPF
jgi:hypothetical protein